MIVVTGTILARPETVDELKRLSLEHTRRSRTEPGCISHDVQIDCENPLRIAFIERWADAAALKTHFLVPASGAFVRQAAKLAAGAPDLFIFDAKELSVKAIMARRESRRGRARPRHARSAAIEVEGEGEIVRQRNVEK